MTIYIGFKHLKGSYSVLRNAFYKSFWQSMWNQMKNTLVFILIHKSRESRQSTFCKWAFLQKSFF